MVAHLLLGDWCGCGGDQEVVIVVAHLLLGDWCWCGGDRGHSGLLHHLLLLAVRRQTAQEAAVVTTLQ